MYFIYFVFCGYRVSIGKAKHIQKRMEMYYRTYFDVFILGVIKCNSEKHAREVERYCLDRFKDDNAFRDMFYLSHTMLNYIVNETEPYDVYAEIDRNNFLEQRRKYNSRPEVKLRNRNFSKTEKRKKQQKEYRNRPENKSKMREYQKEYRKKQKINTR